MLWAVTAITFLVTVIVLLALVYAFTSGEVGIAPTTRHRRCAVAICVLIFGSLQFSPAPSQSLEPSPRSRPTHPE